jgi:hypothetical protein
MSRPFAVAALAALLSFPALAAPGGPGRKGERLYDPATESTFSGRVERLKTVEHGPGVGLHADLVTSDGPVDVHLGPKAFVEEAGVSLAPGDQVEVVGSRVGEGEGAFVVARTVKEGDTVVTLRDADGRPRWAGRRRAR